MGILEAFGRVAGVQAGLTPVTAAAVTASTSVSVPDPATLPIASPWSDGGSLERVVYEDIFGTLPPVTGRAAAMRIPAIARGRNLMCSTVCRFPLRPARRGALLPDTDAPWLYRTGSGTTPQHRLAWTVDDLIFHGWSLWTRANGADGFPLAADRVNQSEWCINSDNRIEINGVEQRDADVILIPGLHEGILSFGVDALADARSLRAIVADRIANPVPQTELHQTEGRDLNAAERQELVAEWRRWRAATGGTVGYTSKGLQLITHGSDADASLMIEARNAAALDLARIIGVSAGMLDATAPKASLNYETSTGRNQEFLDFDLALYMTPITARLSMDDVTPQGRSTVFDTTDYTGPAPSPTGPALED